MFKRTALIVVASLASATVNIAWAETEMPTTLVAPAAIAGGTGSLPPAAGDANGVTLITEVGTVAQVATGVASSRARTQQRVRKEYPNVMGMSLTAWMTARAL